MKKESKFKKNKSKSKSKSPINKKREPKLTEKEKEENRAIMRNMQRKLNFVKNPRFRIEKPYMLLTTDVFKNLLSNENPFAVEPPITFFRNYISGSTYTAKIYLINRTQLLKSFKYNAPKTNHFILKKIEYPKSDSSLIAPGMKAILYIEFKPDSLEPFEDVIDIVTEYFAFKIPLNACREEAALELDNPMNCNTCLIGNHKSMVFRCKNTGGDAHFKFELIETTEKRLKMQNNEEINDKDHNDLIDESMISLQDENNLTLLAGDFSLFPKEFYLKKNMPIEIYVNFAPTNKGECFSKINLICDNQIFSYTIKGEGICTELKLIEYNGNPINEDLKDINFEDTFPQSKSTNRLKLYNNSCVPINYHWDVINYHNKISSILPDEERNFEINPAKGIIQPFKEELFEVDFKPFFAEIYESKLELIIEDIPFQSITKLNPEYFREKYKLNPSDDSFININSYTDPFLPLSSSPFPYYPLMTFKMKGIGKINDLKIDKDFIDFGEVYLGKTYTKDFTVSTLLSGIVLFKLKKMFQFYTKSDSVNKYFRNYKDNRESTFPFEEFITKHQNMIKSEVEKEEEHEYLKTCSNNIMDHILQLADKKLIINGDLIEVNNFFLKSSSPFYVKKIDFNTIKKARKKKAKDYIPPRIRCKKTNITINSNNKEDLTISSKEKLIDSNSLKNTINNESTLREKLNKVQPTKRKSERNEKNISLSKSKSPKDKTKYGLKNKKNDTKSLIQTKSKKINVDVQKYSSTRLSKLVYDPDKIVSENMIYLADNEFEGIKFEINFTPTRLGKFKGTIIFSGQDCQPISLEVKANVIGTNILIDKPAIIFPLSPVSCIQTETFTIKNNSEIECQVLVKENRYKGINFSNYYEYEKTNKGQIEKIKERRKITNCSELMNQNMWKIDLDKYDSYEIKFSDIYFKLLPNESKLVTVYFSSSYPIILQDLIEINVINGETKYLRIKANCQFAECFLNKTLLEPEDIFIGTPISHEDNSLTIINPSNLPVNFKWRNINDPDEKQIFFSPQSGIIEPNSSLVIKYEMIFHTSKNFYKILSKKS